MAKNRNRAQRKWHSIDLHLHTPASNDYQQKEIGYIDILLKAEQRGLDMIAFTDHNTVAGFRKMKDEIQQLELLSKLKRSLPEEEARLKEYRRLLDKITVLPGFEFTATFGFHILGIFPEDKPVREIEHLLLNLNVPSDQLDHGSATIGASADVLTAYRLIKEGGGLAIAAHANSTNGIAMRGFAFGGQTKIAYTQDMNLAALEVTDLENRGRRTTAGFFNGTKPEYPRRMHCIQGSDAHRLDTDPRKKKNLGVGDRVTEVLVSEPSFKALQDLFSGNDFARTRPRRQAKGQVAFDFVKSAREEGANIVQDFHESMTVRGGNLYSIIADVCAFANTNGGTLFIGLSADPKIKPVGIKNPSQAVSQLEKEISNRLSPPLSCTVDTDKTGGVTILRVLVPKGEDPPYAVEDNKIYIREEGETSLAVRDEIVGLVMQGQNATTAAVEPVSLVPKADPVVPVRPETNSGKTDPPRTGVEVVSSSERNGNIYYVVRDLRNGQMVKNVTVKSARRLWHYAITSYAGLPKNISGANIDWKGDFGLLKKYKQGDSHRYDLVQKDNGSHRFYYGVTEDGVHGKWLELLGLEGDE